MSKKHKIVLSQDATTVLVAGDIRNPEPATVVVKFPGGFIEVSRTSDDDYFVHFQRNLETNEEIGERAGHIVSSRVDYTPEAWRANGMTIPPLPAHEGIQHIAVKVSVTDREAA